MNATVFLLLNLALSFYLIGTIWAHEVDIFRTWKLIDAKDFLTRRRYIGTSWRIGSSHRWDWRSSGPLFSSGITLVNLQIGRSGAIWPVNLRRTS
jgi:hypothetical protein